MGCVRKILHTHIYIPILLYTSTRYPMLLNHVPLRVSEVVSSGKETPVRQRPGSTGDEYKNSTGEMNNIFVIQRFNCSITCNILYSKVCGLTTIDTSFIFCNSASSSSDLRISYKSVIFHDP